MYFDLHVKIYTKTPSYAHTACNVNTKTCKTCKSKYEMIKIKIMINAKETLVPIKLR